MKKRKEKGPATPASATPASQNASAIPPVVSTHNPPPPTASEAGPSRAADSSELATVDEPPPVRKRKPRARPIKKIPATAQSTIGPSVETGDTLSVVSPEAPMASSLSQPIPTSEEAEQVNIATDESTQEMNANPMVPDAPLVSAQDVTPSVAVRRPRARPLKRSVQPPEVSEAGPSSENSPVVLETDPAPESVDTLTAGGTATSDQAPENTQQRGCAQASPQISSSKRKGKARAESTTAATSNVPAEGSTSARKAQKRPHTEVAQPRRTASSKRKRLSAHDPSSSSVEDSGPKDDPIARMEPGEYTYQPRP